MAFPIKLIYQYAINTLCEPHGGKQVLTTGSRLASALLNGIINSLQVCWGLGSWRACYIPLGWWMWVAIAMWLGLCWGRGNFYCCLLSEPVRIDEAGKKDLECNLKSRWEKGSVRMTVAHCFTGAFLLPPNGQDQCIWKQRLSNIDGRYLLLRQVQDTCIILDNGIVGFNILISALFQVEMWSMLDLLVCSLSLFVNVMLSF